MVHQLGRMLFSIRRTLLLPLLLVAAGISITTYHGTAQNYTCFPSCDPNDARMLSIASTGLNTLSGQDVILSLATPGSATTITVGVFDGETGKLSGGASHWDIGTVPLMYTLFADPNGDGTGTFQVAQWSGDSMPDNDWFNATLNNVSQAHAASGAYFYTLRIRTTDLSTTHWSSFKIRTSGAIIVRPGQAFSISAPLPNLQTAQIVYPNFPDLTETTYDGNWTFYLNVPSPLSSIELWDGDLDFGDYQCVTSDEDDDDTPPVLPSWTPANTSAVSEGVAISAIHCANGDTATGNPTDDSQSPVLRREPNIYYELIDPNGLSYVNGNPSGNLEWEQFRISTAPFNRDLMDYQADSIPAGVYTLNIYGMDLQNLDAFRFPPGSVVTSPYLIGVDSSGSPVAPPSPIPPPAGVISGTVFYDGNSNGIIDATEGRVAGVDITMLLDVDGDLVPDFTRTTATDQNGKYQFTQIPNGSAQIFVDSTDINANAAPTVDPDGTGTRYRASLALTNATHIFNVANFGFHQVLSASIHGLDTMMASGETTYTSTASETGVTYLWTITGSGSIDGAANTANVDVLSSSFGSFTLTLTISKNGSTFKVKHITAVLGIDFAVLGYSSVDMTGRCGTDATRAIYDGNIGVNQGVSGCNPQPNLRIAGSGCTQHKAFVTDGSRVMGDYTDLGSLVSVWDLYANRTTGSTSSATKRHAGPISFCPPIYATCNLPRIPCFDYSCTNFTVNANQTRSLNPGKYSVITVNNGGVLNLSNGIYNIKSIRACNNVTINTQAGTKVRIGRDFLVGTNGFVGTSPAALFIVRSDGVCSGSASVSFGTGTEFHGQILAPNGTVDLGTSTDLEGRFWGKRVTAGCDVNITYWGPVNTFHNNNDGFQKKLIDPAVTGGASMTMMKQSYPNPFSSSTTLALALSEDSPVTLKIVDATGNSVRTLMENAVVAKGDTKVTWDGLGYAGQPVPSGNYFFYLQVGNHAEAQPIVLTR